MILQRADYPCGCVIAAAAMCMDAPQKRLVDLIGHSGQEDWFPEKRGCARKRGIHMQEIIDAAFVLGWAVVPFEVRPSIGTPENFRELWPIERVTLRTKALFKLVDRALIRGVYPDTLLRHAVAWGSKQFFDPNGTVTTDCPLSIETVYGFFKCSVLQSPPEASILSSPTTRATNAA